MFGVPKGARKVKPFVDHVLGFTLADGKIWIRCYQISESEPGKKKPVDGEEMEVNKNPKKRKHDESEVSLVEIGPRFVLTPIVIQESRYVEMSRVNCATSSHEPVSEGPSSTRTRSLSLLTRSDLN